MDQPQNIVRCFDQMHHIWWNRMWQKTLLSTSIFGGCVLFDKIVGCQWMQFVGFAIVTLGIVIPQIIQIHRGYACQICPSCGKEVGGYETSKNRIILVCKNCDSKTPTDCSIYDHSGPPVRTP